MDQDPDPGGQKHVDPVDPDPDSAKLENTITWSVAMV
jgi:hypothetical protein